MVEQKSAAGLALKAKFEALLPTLSPDERAILLDMLLLAVRGAEAEGRVSAEEVQGYRFPANPVAVMQHMSNGGHQGDNSGGGWAPGTAGGAQGPDPLQNLMNTAWCLWAC